VPPAEPDDHAIAIHLDKLLADRGMTLTELSERVGVSVVNLSILKNGHARAIRFSTLTRLCQALECQPGDLLSYDGADGRAGPPPASAADLTEPESPARPVPPARNRVRRYAPPPRQL
jgi:putative transcriptional regulator